MSESSKLPITQRDNFISYSRRELTFVNWLAAQFEREDVSYWLDFHQIQVGYAWRDQIMGAIEQCTTFLLVVSDDSLSRQVVQEEISAAFQHNKRVILLIFEGVPIDDERLLDCQWVDFRASLKTGLSDLLTILNTAPSSPVSQPPTDTKIPIQVKRIQQITPLVNATFLVAGGLSLIAAIVTVNIIAMFWGLMILIAGIGLWMGHRIDKQAFFDRAIELEKVHRANTLAFIITVMGIVIAFPLVFVGNALTGIGVSLIFLALHGVTVYRAILMGHPELYRWEAPLPDAKSNWFTRLQAQIGKRLINIRTTVSVITAFATVAGLIVASNDLMILLIPIIAITLLTLYPIGVIYTATRTYQHFQSDLAQAVRDDDRDLLTLTTQSSPETLADTMMRTVVIRHASVNDAAASALANAFDTLDVFVLPQKDYSSADAVLHLLSEHYPLPDYLAQPTTYLPNDQRHIPIILQNDDSYQPFSDSRLGDLHLFDATRQPNMTELAQGIVEHIKNRSRLVDAQIGHFPQRLTGDLAERDREWQQKTRHKKQRVLEERLSTSTHTVDMLSEMFNFDDGDLQANQAGHLSEAQKRQLKWYPLWRALRFQWIAAVIVIFILTFQYYVPDGNLTADTLTEFLLIQMLVTGFAFFIGAALLIMVLNLLLFRLRNPSLNHLEIQQVIGRPEQHVYRVRVGSHENGEDRYKEYVCWRIRQQLVFFSKKKSKRQLKPIDGAYRIFVCLNVLRIKGKFVPLLLSVEPYTIDPTTDIAHIGNLRAVEAIPD